MLKKIIIILIALISFFTLHLYSKDMGTAKQAIIVRNYLNEHYKQENRYPNETLFWSKFPELRANQWYYWPNKEFSHITFQYPMNLPVWGAPGKAKLSEFLPVIYSYTVRDPHN